MTEHPGHNAVNVAAQDARHVRNRFALPQTDLLGRKIHTVATQLRDRDIKTDSCTKRWLFEQECHRPPREETAHLALLHHKGLFYKLLNLAAAEVSNGEEVFLHVGLV